MKMRFNILLPFYLESRFYFTNQDSTFTNQDSTFTIQNPGFDYKNEIQINGPYSHQSKLV